MTKKCDFCTEPCGFSHCITNDNIPTFDEYSYNEDIDNSVFDIDAILKENELLKEKVAHLEQLLLSVTGHLVVPTPDKVLSHEEVWNDLEDAFTEEEINDIIKDTLSSFKKDM